MLNPDWDQMDEVEAIGHILREALVCGAGSINFSSDNAGASIYFTINGELESYTHLAPTICQKVRHYFKQMASIDLHKKPPQDGFSVYRVDGFEYTISIQTLQAETYEDLQITISSL